MIHDPDRNYLQEDVIEIAAINAAAATRVLFYGGKIDYNEPNLVVSPTITDSFKCCNSITAQLVQQSLNVASKLHFKLTLI